ncbi:MAG: hypothetical protein CUN51_03880 [Candidatus Thermofonsia Clade 1 bacterium]|uniref:GmrSD restriction endonucleases N-terminal domain-containing protein n=1 Tax=Candidatus Thermofonsia Clade 1 bacterium TaxID=2364210 RepID=A0A2M8P1P6_9CHLR|nr:MAG: hypothetical protein CUN51_03880 [Candidatus Thermofonsia Clade 1 bacterium]
MTDELIVRSDENQDEEQEQQVEGSALPFMRYSITSYGADYTVDQLVERMKRGDLYIPAFQRGYVWKIHQASQLIESLLLGLPVPSIFVSRDDKNRLLIIDGHQRLSSLRYFFAGKFPRDPNQLEGKSPENPEDADAYIEFRLMGVQAPFAGKTYQTLSEEDRRQLNDSVIRAVILQQNAPREEFATSIYFIFRRLNTNSSPLTQQEIRAAVFDGSLNGLLKELDNYETWTHIYTSKVGRLRKRGQEVILRFFAFYERLDQYAGSLEVFLNDYMNHNMQASDEKISQLRKRFISTLDAIYDAIGERAFRFSKGRFNAAFFDAAMVAVAKRLEEGKLTKSKLASAYRRLSANREFENAAIVSTSDVSQVQKRMRIAIETFSKA